MSIAGGRYVAHDVLELACDFMSERGAGTPMESAAPGFAPDAYSPSVAVSPPAEKLAGFADLLKETLATIALGAAACVCSSCCGCRASPAAVGADGAPPPPLHEASTNPNEMAKSDLLRSVRDIKLPKARSAQRLYES
jgi:hypothetical protein